MESKKDKPLMSQLCFLCGLEPAIHSFIVVINRSRFFCRPGIV